MHGQLSNRGNVATRFRRLLPRHRVARVLFFLIPACAGVFAVGGGALAGYKEPVDEPALTVQVVPTNGSDYGYAYGSIGSTRRTGTSTGYIGCRMEADLEWGNTAICEAYDGTNSISCRLDPLNFEYHLAAIRNMTPSSTILFQWEYQSRWNERICTYLVVIESSIYEPPQ